MANPPRPNYQRNVDELINAYKEALSDVQAQLNSLFLTDMKRDQIQEVEKEIKAILAALAVLVEQWATDNLEEAAVHGVADTLLVLGLASSYAEALEIAKISRVNRQLISAAIADTQEDLLAVTQNMNRQAKLAIRKAVAQATRAQLATGDTAFKQLAKNIRNEIKKASDVAIIDSKGRRWKVETYAAMVASTNMMNAQRESAMVSAIQEGCLYATISKHNAKDACAKWEGKIVKLVPEAPGDYPYVGDLPRNEIFHPNCRHILLPLRDPSLL